MNVVETLHSVMFLWWLVFHFNEHLTWMATQIQVLLFYLLVARSAPAWLRGQLEVWRLPSFLNSGIPFHFPSESSSIFKSLWSFLVDLHSISFLFSLLSVLSLLFFHFLSVTFSKTHILINYLLLHLKVFMLSLFCLLIKSKIYFNALPLPKYLLSPFLLFPAPSGLDQ